MSCRTRLMNEMVRSADGVEMIADFEAMLARFVEINERFLADPPGGAQHAVALEGSHLGL